MYSQKLDTSISFGDFLAMFDDADSGLIRVASSASSGALLILLNAIFVGWQTEAPLLLRWVFDGTPWEPWGPWEP